jgi:Aldo/keto reductase family
MVKARDNGLIGGIGLSNITREHLVHALAITDIACVQNPMNLADRHSLPVLEECEAQGIAFVPFFPLGRDPGAARPYCGQRGLVDQVGQVRAGEPGGGRGDLTEVGAWLDILATGVGGRDGAPLGPVGQRDHDLAVEPAGPAQRRVECVPPVGGGQYNYLAAVLESVHLGEQLVEGLLPLVIAGQAAGFAAGTQGIDLVYEHDRRSAAPGRSNRSRTLAAPTPTNISTKLDPDTDRKGTWASPATARASSVLPVPGGPAISTPRGPRAPARW